MLGEQSAILDEGLSHLHVWGSTRRPSHTACTLAVAGCKFTTCSHTCVHACMRGLPMQVSCSFRTLGLGALSGSGPRQRVFCDWIRQVPQTESLSAQRGVRMSRGGSGPRTCPLAQIYQASRKPSVGDDHENCEVQWVPLLGMIMKSARCRGCLRAQDPQEVEAFTLDVGQLWGNTRGRRS
eukprot:scaffold288373_cov15-Tisochrysis_lutea.AAC.1